MTCPGPLSPYFHLDLIYAYGVCGQFHTSPDGSVPWSAMDAHSWRLSLWSVAAPDTVRSPSGPSASPLLPCLPLIGSLLCPYCHQTGPWHLLSGRWRQPLARLPATSVDCRGLLTNPSNMLLGLHHSWAQNPCVVSSHIQNKVQIPLQNF